MSLLCDYPLARSRDLDAVRRSVADALCPHRLDVTGCAGKVDARFAHRRYRHTSVSYISFGARVDIGIRAGAGSFFVVPLSGECRYARRGDVIALDQDTGGVISPKNEVRLQVSPEATILVLTIDQAAVECAVADILGYRIPFPVEFDPCMDLTDRAGRSWLDCFRRWTRFLRYLDGQVADPLLCALEDSVIAGFVRAQRHNYSSMFVRNVEPASSRVVCQVIELMEQAPDPDRHVSDYARQAGVDERVLHEGFRLCYGVTPEEYLLGVRLRATYEDLLFATVKTDTVAEVAARWGFDTVGSRFFRLYSDRFGELPVDTLRR